MHPRARRLVELLELKPHPEGGHYREVFRSAGTVDPGDGRGARAGLTSIHYLLSANERSRWHRVESDEAWHLTEGGPLELLVYDESARRVDRHVLAAAEGASGPLAVVPAGVWQAARPLGPFALVGCSVGPGFDFDDFEMMEDRPATIEALGAISGDHLDLV